MPLVGRAKWPGGHVCVGNSVGVPHTRLAACEPRGLTDRFSLDEVSLDGVPPYNNPACLIYYFRGLVTCPYGQSPDGQAPECASPCTTIAGQPITGTVAPECANRPASKTVFWSCRCADPQGTTSNGTYCSCPSGMACAQVFPSFGAEDERAGAYCVPPSFVPDGVPSCSTSCDPTMRTCQ